VKGQGFVVYDVSGLKMHQKLKPFNFFVAKVDVELLFSDEKESPLVNGTTHGQ